MAGRANRKVPATTADSPRPPHSYRGAQWVAVISALEPRKQAGRSRIPFRGGGHPRRIPEPVSRLEMVRSEVDRLFGDGFAAPHPELGAATMATGASDWAAARLASAIEQVAVALVAEEQSAPPNGALVRAHQSLVRP